MIVSVKQHTTGGVAKVVNPLGTVVTLLQSDDDDCQEADRQSEDVVIHENCDEALFRPVVASKTLCVFSEPKIVTNSLPDTQTAIVETPSLVSTGPKNYANKSRSNLTNIRNKSTFNEEESLNSNKNHKTKTPKKAEKAKSLPQKEVVFDYDSNKSKASKTETLDGALLHQLDSFIDHSIPSHENDFTFEPTSKTKSDVDGSKTKSNEWNEMSYEYTFDENEKQLLSKELFDIENSIKLNYEQYNKMATDEKNDEKQMTKRTRKPKTKLGVRLGKTIEPFDVTKSDEEQPIEKIVVTLPPPSSPSPPLCPPPPTTKKSWSSIAAQKPADGVVESNNIPALERENAPNLLKVGDKSDDEKQENVSSQSETTESDDSSKVVQLIAMDTEEDAYQAEFTKNEGQAIASKSNGKKKPKKKRR